VAREEGTMTIKVEAEVELTRVVVVGRQGKGEQHNGVRLFVRPFSENPDEVVLETRYNERVVSLIRVTISDVVDLAAVLVSNKVGALGMPPLLESAGVVWKLSQKGEKEEESE
jgi:hypothetical protein